ncbi:hypothetical protein QFC19_007335 [Naganishia cerealis]|uniref:Uncharacterized protein n=1 Tax=Naganishia cerealis TaxID=610337 RepID=A0ACC2VAA4_9TREE|nr:hypothetical protein QFC19_007335 [Naganishia cerealis]
MVESRTMRQSARLPGAVPPVATNNVQADDDRRRKMGGRDTATIARSSRTGGSRNGALKEGGTGYVKRVNDNNRETPSSDE